MPDILVILGHPAADKSLIHKRLIEAASTLPGVTVNNLYTAYPDFVIDVEKEQALLRNHQHIVMQHPLYWYSSPALLKQWQDSVLDYGFAYGESGTALHGKSLQQVITTGSAAHAFNGEGDNCTMETLLKPFEQMARKCGMQYRAPYVIHNAGRMDNDALANAAAHYTSHLQESYY